MSHDEQAWCHDCGKPHIVVRPGKTQATCECWATCAIHGRYAIEYHPEGTRPGISGYYCLQCNDELGGGVKPS